MHRQVSLFQSRSAGPSTCCVVRASHLGGRPQVRWQIGRINRRPRRAERVVDGLIAHVDHSRCASGKRGWPRKETPLHEGRLQPELERGNRTRLIAESGFEMSQGLCRRLLCRALRCFAHAGQCRADGGLCLEKTLPDPIRRRIAQAAFEIAKRLQFVPAGHRIFQKGPQALGVQEKAMDLIGPPDAEGPTASGCSPSIAAKDPLCSSRFPTLVLVVVSAQIPMPNQVPHTPAVWTSGQLQVGQNRIELLRGFAHAHDNDSPQSPTSTQRL